MKRYNFNLSADYTRDARPRPVLVMTQADMPLTFLFAVTLASLTAWVAWFG